MFVRVKKIGNYEYLYLVENAREGGRHVQRVVEFQLSGIGRTRPLTEFRVPRAWGEARDPLSAIQPVALCCNVFLEVLVAPNTIDVGDA